MGGKISYGKVAWERLRLSSKVNYTDRDHNSGCNYYNRLGRLISVVEYAAAGCTPKALGVYTFVTNYFYDEVGNLRKVTNAATQSTTYSYDNLNRLTLASYPDGASETYSYDNNGNVVKKVDRAGVKTLSSYDSLNRISTVTYCGTTITGTSYVYDKNGNPLQVLNENATVTYIYDSRNRVLNETYAVNPATRTVVDLGCSGTGGSITRTGGVAKTYMVGTTYSGELVSTIAYPTICAWNPDITIKYSYDGLGRILNVLNVSTSLYFAQLTYSKADQVVGVQYGNGLVANYTYDQLSRPNTVTLKNPSTNSVMMSLTYSYNNTGTVSGLVGQVNSATLNEQYKYDPLQRLVNSTVTNGGGKTTFWYRYDNVGNMIAQSVNGTITNYTYNQANNELVSSSSPGTSTGFAYDQDGNLLNKNVTTTGTVRWYYTWDPAGDLLKVTNSTGQASYAYDGGGRRVEAVESGAVWYFAYTGTEILYKNRLNTYNCAYIFASGLRIANFANGSTYYYHADALGSIRMITYPNAAVAYTNGYQPYGQYTGTLTGNLGKWAIDKFDGKPFSSTTGLYYYYHRWYDPSIGRFISPDPKHGKLANPQSLNLYVYVTGNPTTSEDPSGLSSCGFLNPLGCLTELIVPPPNLVTIVINLIVPTGRRVVKKLGDTITTVVDSTVRPLVTSGARFITSEIGSITSQVRSVTSEIGSITSQVRSVTNYDNIVNYGRNTISNLVRRVPSPSGLENGLGNLLNSNAQLIEAWGKSSGFGPMIPCTACLISTPSGGVNLGDWSHVSINLNNVNWGQVGACAVAAGIIAGNFVPGPDILDFIFGDPILLYETGSYCASGV